MTRISRREFLGGVVASAAVIGLPSLANADDLKVARHDFPNVGPYQVLCGDFHMHTVNSDGKLTTRQRVEQSYEWGYDAIAVTDHGNSRAYRVAKGVGEKLGMVVLCGFETGILKNEHLVVLNVSPSYKPRDPHRMAEKPGEATVFYQDELKAISEAGGYVLYPHPHVGYREYVKWGVEQGIIQGIESKNGVVGSGWNTVEDHGTHWYPSAVAYAMENNLAIFANSDVHGNRAADTSPVTLLLATNRSSEGVMDAIKGRRTAAWFNGMLWGRERELAAIIGASVRISRSDGILVQNLCPIAFKGTAAGQKIDLAPYESAKLNSVDSKTVRFKWDNVWTGLETNLTTMHHLS